MYEYEMGPAKIVEDTEQTRLCLQTDGRMDKVKRPYPSFNFVAVGYNTSHDFYCIYLEANYVTTAKVGTRQFTKERPGAPFTNID